MRRPFGQSLSGLIVFAISLCIACIVSVNTAGAAVVGETFSVDGVTYLVLSPVAVQVGDGASSSSLVVGNLDIPSSVSDGQGSYTVTHIGDWAFADCDGLTSVTIPSSVTSLGRYAFYRDDQLASVSIPNSVTSMGDHAFWGCTRLSSIVFPNSITAISDDSFTGCFGLTSVTIPNSVTSIGINAFQACVGLSYVSIPSSVTSIGNAAFDQCYDLTSIDIPASVTRIGDAAFQNCWGLTEVTIPDSVTAIGVQAFALCRNLTSATISNSLASIADRAFLECPRLTSVTIPSSVTYIGVSAFDGCTSLAALTFASATTSIFDSASTIPGQTMIVGYDPSTAQDYAVKYGRRFGAIGSDFDSDGDGLPDSWERSGVLVNGQFIDLPAMGADPYRKDIFVQADWMEFSPLSEAGSWRLGGYSYKPSQDALDLVREAFEAQGVTLHVDAGPDSLMSSGEPWGRLSDAGPVTGKADLGRTVQSTYYEPYAKVWQESYYDWTDFNSIKSSRFRRTGVFRYCLFVRHYGGGKSTGIAQFPPGTDFIVADRSAFDGEPINQEAGTFMHELGHTLGLFHGGGDQVNYKPNYLSVMNYTFQMSGLTKDGSQGWIDYSQAELDSLNEASLDEGAGIGPKNAVGNYGTKYFRWSDGAFRAISLTGPINWNGFWGDTESGIQVDLNGSGEALDILTGHDDWANLVFTNVGIGPSSPPASSATRGPLTVADTGSLDKMAAGMSSVVEPPYGLFLSRGLVIDDYSVGVHASEGDVVVATPGARNRPVPYAIANKGTLPDTYTVEAFGLDGRGIEGFPIEVPVSAGASFTISVPTEIPADSKEGRLGVMRVRATSQGNPLVAASCEVSLDYLTRGTVDGTVTSNGTPLSGASVSVNSSNPAATTAEGKFTISEVMPGTQMVTFSKAGFETRTMTVTVAAGLPSVVSVDLVRSSTLSLSTTSTASLAYGSAFSIDGTLKSGADGIGGVPVVLQSGPPNGAFRDTSLTAITAAGGEFNFSVKPTKKTCYRVRFPGSAGCAGSGPTASVYATPKVRLARYTSWSTLALSRTYSAKGDVAPRHAIGDSNKIRIRAYKQASNGKYYYKRSFVASYSYYSSTKTRYTAAVRLTSKGRWKLIAYHAGDDTNAKTYGSADYVTVR